jgi:NADH-quinone oxidoreductase subunit C
MSEALNDLAAYIGEKLPGKIQESLVAYGELTITVEPSDIISTLTF